MQFNAKVGTILFIIIFFTLVGSWNFELSPPMEKTSIIESKVLPLPFSLGYFRMENGDNIAVSVNDYFAFDVGDSYNYTLRR